jgi:hypothetical protein
VRRENPGKKPLWLVVVEIFNACHRESFISSGN